LDIDTIRKTLDAHYADDRESLFVLAGDPTTFWNVHLYFEEMGTIGLVHWDNMISAAMEDPDVALVGYEDVVRYPTGIYPSMPSLFVRFAKQRCNFCLLV
jgi:hypothetical protein